MPRRPKKTENAPDKTLVDQVIDTLSVPGSTTRSLFIESVKAFKEDEDFNYEEVMDNMSKKDYTSPDEFLSEMESSFGVPKRVASGLLGSAVGASTGAKIGFLTPYPGGAAAGAVIGAIAGGGLGGFTDLGANFLTDVATDPIGLLFRPASALRGSKAGTKLAEKSLRKQRLLQRSAEGALRKGKVNKAITAEAGRLALKGISGNPDDLARAATGATLGAMSIEHDDSIADMVTKVGAMTVAGPSALRIVDKAGFKLNRLAEERLNRYYIRRHKDIFDKVRGTHTDQILAEGRRKGLGGEDLDSFLETRLDELMQPVDMIKIARKASDSPEFKKDFFKYLEAEQGIHSAARKEFEREAKGLLESGQISLDEVDALVDNRMEDFFYKRGDAFTKQIFDREHSYMSQLQQDVFRNTYEARKVKGLDSLQIDTPDGKVVVDENFVRNPTERHMREAAELLNKGEIDLKGAEEFVRRKAIRDLEIVTPRSTRDKLLSIATSEANNNIRKWMHDNLDPSMAEAFKKVKMTNFKRIGEYNKRMSKKFGKEHFPIQSFDYWAFDLDRASTIADGLGKVSDTLIKRSKDEVVSHIKGIERGVMDQRAASAWAGVFMADKEKMARGIVSKMVSGRDQSTSLKRMFQNIQMVRNPTLVKRLRPELAKEGKAYNYVDMLNENSEIMMNIHDQWLSMIKGVHLVTNSTWTKNNLFENTVNAYVMGGARGGVEALSESVLGPIAVASNKLGKRTGIKILEDMGKHSAFERIYKALDPSVNPNSSVKAVDYGDDAINISRDFGVISDTKFTDYRNLMLSGDTGLVSFLAGERGAEKIAQQLIDEGKISKWAKNLNKGMWENVIGRYNNISENTMRHVAFKENAKSIARVKYRKELADVINGHNKAMSSRRKYLLSKPDLEDYLTSTTDKAKGIKDFEDARDLRASYKEAKGMVDKIFFDYGNVTEFEREVMKRIFPYWTFWTRNFRKFTDIMFDPDLLPRVAKSTKAFTSKGRPLREDERASVPDFFREKGARVVRKSRKGDVEVLTAPSLAILEFANNFKAEDVLSRVSPIIKTIPIIGESGVLNMDFLTKQQLLPTEKDPTVRIFENAITQALPDSVLRSMNIFRDKYGNLTTNSRKTARALHAQKNIAPFIVQIPLPKMSKPFVKGVPIGGFADQSARAKRNIDYRGSEVERELKEFLSPFRTSLVRKEQAERLKEKTERAVEVLKSDEEEVVINRGKPSKSERQKRRRELMLKRKKAREKKKRQRRNLREKRRRSKK